MNTTRVDAGYLQLVKRFPLIPIRDKKHFDAAIKIMKELSYKNESLSRPEADYLSVLSDLIFQYEKKHVEPPGEVTPVDALKYLMEVGGLKPSDLTPIVGHKSNLSAFLHGRRALSKGNALRLAEYFKVSPALFLN